MEQHAKDTNEIQSDLLQTCMCGKCRIVYMCMEVNRWVHAKSVKSNAFEVNWKNANSILKDMKLSVFQPQPKSFQLDLKICSLILCDALSLNVFFVFFFY